MYDGTDVCHYMSYEAGDFVKWLLANDYVSVTVKTTAPANMYQLFLNETKDGTQTKP